MKSMPAGNEQLTIYGKAGDEVDSGLRILARIIARKYASERAGLSQKERLPANANVCNE